MHESLREETGLTEEELRAALDEMTKHERELITQRRGGSTHDVSGFFF